MAVTAASQVNLSSTSLRLAKPEPTPADPPPSNSSDDTGTESTRIGSLTKTGDPHPATKKTGTATPTAAAERQINLSFTQNLLANQASADDLASMFKALYTALDERNISYLQATLQLIGESATIDRLKMLLDEVGIQANVKDM